MTRVSRLQLWNACLGNLFEHYDTALFGFLSLFLSPLIFPEHDPITALILTYAIIPLGMIGRPFGALIFGYIGDVYGRTRALFLTLAGMSLVSGCFALSPTYSQVGIMAPILFFIGRFLQNFFSAGETMGGAIFVLENSSEKHHDLLSSLYSASTMGGHLLASFGIFLLSYYNAIDPGWRVLYLFGCLTALFGCIARRFPHPDQASARSSPTFSNLKNTFLTHWKPFLLIVLGAGFANANYYVALVLMNGFVPLVSSMTKAEIMQINTYMLIFDFFALPFFGWLASKISREKLMLSASLGVVLFSMPLLMSLEGASLAGVIGVRTVFVIFGVAFFAPFHAWAQQLIPPSCRYAIISVGYALGSQLLGTPTAALALWCFQKTGMIASVSWYWMLLAMGSSLAIMMANRVQTSVFKRSTESSSAVGF